MKAELLDCAKILEKNLNVRVKEIDEFNDAVVFSLEAP